MKVLHLLTSKIFSGAENVVYQIMTMTKDEKDLSMVYVAAEGPVREELEKREVPYELLPAVNVKNVKEVIRHQKPDLIHAHDVKASVIAALACGKIPLVCHIHNNDPTVQKASLKAFAFLPAAFKAKKIFWVSQSACEGYVFQKSFDGKSQILRNIVDSELVQKKSEEDSNTYSYDILFIGRFEYPKNPQRFVRVINKVAENCQGISAAMIGAGSEQVPDSQFIEKLGFRSNPYKILKDTKILLITSDWEGLSMVALEAMVFGIPVISMRAGGIEELIEYGVNGYLCSTEDELAVKTLEVLNNKELWKKLSENQQKKSAVFNNKNIYLRTLLTAYEKT